MPNKEKDMIQVVIADDHPIVREALVQIITNSTDLSVIGEAADGVELLKLIRELAPDVLITDVDMPKKNGWEVISQVKAEFPDLPILVLSAFSEEEYGISFLKAGASGYLNKAHEIKKIPDAIRKVAHGGKVFGQVIAEKLVSNLHKNTDKNPHETLSPREFQIFFMIASGKSVTEISEELSLSVPTISSYRSRMLEKMGLESNPQVVGYAFRHNILK